MFQADLEVEGGVFFGAGLAYCGDFLSAFDFGVGADVVFCVVGVVGGVAALVFDDDHFSVARDFVAAVNDVAVAGAVDWCALRGGDE